MISQMISRCLPEWSLHQKQTNNIIFITFWSQFSVYALNTVLILFLTRPLLEHGLGYSQTKAYAFIGVTQATGYLMPVLGGYMADTIIGVRRSILLGSILLACAYLLVMMSSYTLDSVGDQLFIAAFAFIPATNSLLIGTASSMISHIYIEDAIKAKSAMTYYYMAINIGGLLATFISPMLLESRYGPLSILAITFFGKAIAALNFAKNYSIYNNILWGNDKVSFDKGGILKLILYILTIYLFTLFAYSHINTALILISMGCSMGLFWFLVITLKLKGTVRSKQLIALILILAAVVFFVLYNQMNSTMVLFAQNNSNHNMLGFTIAPAQYQLLNPLLILLIGSQLPRFYRTYPRFTIPYQFAAGTILAGFALLILVFAASRASNGLVEGNYIALTYILLTIAELWVSAVGLSMVGLYCDGRTIAFAMGVWYLAISLSNTISGKIAAWVAIPETTQLPTKSLPYYQSYYLLLGVSALVIGFLMYLMAFFLLRVMNKNNIALA